MVHRYKAPALLFVLALSLLAATAHAIPFEDCGRVITAHTERCFLFDSDLFGVYQLDDYGEYGEGDWVHVRGDLDPDYASQCTTDGAITVELIELCQAVGTRQVTWGKIRAIYR